MLWALLQGLVGRLLPARARTAVRWLRALLAHQVGAASRLNIATGYAVRSLAQWAIPLALGGEIAGDPRDSGLNDQ
jgi:hypothetical protein